MSGRRTLLAIGIMLAGFAWTASQAVESAIYTCVDAKGRRLTSDRPIIECIDREQKELNPSGSVRRKVAPSPTAEELARKEEMEKQAAEERSRLAEEKRRDRALLVRYPTREAHEKERNDALAQVDAVIHAANKRIDDLQAQRKKINSETEFYRKDMTKVPPSLKRQIDENDASIASQKRFIADQESEKKRINARFDEELVKLKPLWVAQATPVMPASAPAKAANASAKPGAAQP